MRLFLGLELPDDLKNQINAYLLPLHQNEKGWEKPHDYHQTLLFIGEASEHDLITIQEKMDAFNFSHFDLTTKSFQFFNRRIMYLGFEESLELLALKTKIDQLFPEWQKESAKNFISHVTVKRWQRYEYDHLVKGLAQSEFATSKMTVSALSLFKSEKDPENNKYHVIYRKKF